MSGITGDGNGSVVGGSEFSVRSRGFDLKGARINRGSIHNLGEISCDPVHDVSTANGADTTNLRRRGIGHERDLVGLAPSRITTGIKSAGANCDVCLIGG